MAADPQATLPEAMGDDAALEGAYRLMNNARISSEALVAAHAKVTALRARGAPEAVLVIHDTTLATAIMVAHRWHIARASVPS